MRSIKQVRRVMERLGEEKQGIEGKLKSNLEKLFKLVKNGGRTIYSSKRFLELDTAYDNARNKAYKFNEDNEENKVNIELYEELYSNLVDLTDIKKFAYQESYLKNLRSNDDYKSANKRIGVTPGTNNHDIHIIAHPNL